MVYATSATTAATSRAAHAEPSTAATHSRPHVVIVSSVRLFREGLAELVERGGWSNSIARASTCDEAEATLEGHESIVALIDASDAQAAESARRLSQRPSVLGVIAFATADEVESRLVLAEAGVRGYISRDGSVADLLAVVDRACRGELECSPRLAGALARRLAQLSSGNEADSRADLLSYRERDIVRLVDEGMSNKEISRQLHIEVATVKNHIHNILHKLGVRRRGEAAAALRRWRVALSRSGVPAPVSRSRV